MGRPAPVPLVAPYRPPAGSAWAELGSEHGYMWRHLAHHLHEAGLVDELAEVLASPEYVVKKAAHLGNESLAHRQGRRCTALSRPGTATWRTAQILTSSRTPSSWPHLPSGHRGYAAGRHQPRPAQIPGVLGKLRDIAGARGFDTLWASTAPGGADAHAGAVAQIAAHGDSLVSGGEDGVVRIWDLARPSRPTSGTATRAGSTRWRSRLTAGPRLRGRRCDHPPLAARYRPAHRRPVRSRPADPQPGIRSGRPPRVRSRGRPGLPLGYRARQHDPDDAHARSPCLGGGRRTWRTRSSQRRVRMNSCGCTTGTAATLIVEKAAHRDWIRALSLLETR